jgi:hypothetical protein
MSVDFTELVPNKELFNQKVGIEYCPAVLMLDTVVNNSNEKGAMNKVSLFGFIHKGTNLEELEEW